MQGNQDRFDRQIIDGPEPQLLKAIAGRGLNRVECESGKGTDGVTQATGDLKGSSPLRRVVNPLPDQCRVKSPHGTVIDLEPSRPSQEVVGVLVARIRQFQSPSTAQNNRHDRANRPNETLWKHDAKGSC